MADPKFTDKHRFGRPYVQSKDMGDGYLQRRFKEIEDQQRTNAEERLRKCVEMKKARSK